MGGRSFAPIIIGGDKLRITRQALRILHDNLILGASAFKKSKEFMPPRIILTDVPETKTICIRKPKRFSLSEAVKADAEGLDKFGSPEDFNN